jgi:hypothetical protein
MNDMASDMCGEYTNLHQDEECAPHHIPHIRTVPAYGLHRSKS